MSSKKTSYVTIISCIIVQFCLGILYIWSILKADAIAFYGWESGSANLVASFMLFAFCFGNFIGGSLNDRIGPKKTAFPGVISFAVGVFLASLLGPGSSVVLFYLTYCIIGGLGSGIAYGAILSCIQKWMPHKLGFATGIATGSFGFGTVIFSPLISALLKAMPINTVLKCLAAGFIIVCLIACSMIRLPDEQYLASLPKPAAKKNVVAKKDMSLSQAAKTIPFWCLVASAFFFNGTWNMLNPLIKDLGMARGLGESAAIICVSLTGLANASGRLIMSSLSDKIGRINTMFILSGLTVVAAICLMFIGGYGFFAIVLLTAFTFGGPAAVHPAICSDLFGLKYTGTNYGVIMLGLGFSSLFFNFISNILYAATGAYYATFAMGAVSVCITFAAMLIIRSNLKKHS